MRLPGVLTNCNAAMSVPPWLSCALISWMLPKVLSRRMHATKHPAVQQPLSTLPHMADYSSKLLSSCRHLPSTVLTCAVHLFLCYSPAALPTSIGPFVSSHDRGSGDVCALLIIPMRLPGAPIKSRVMTKYLSTKSIFAGLRKRSRSMRTIRT